MHLYPHSNDSSHNERFSESVLLQEIRKIQLEEREEYVEESSYMAWFFSMSRENGGYSRFKCMGIQLPLSLDITLLCWILAFIIPVVGFCLIIPALRKKACASFIVVMIFSSTGLALITGLLTTSWLVGEVEGHMTIGPLNPRCNVRVGMWVGLSNINITLETRKIYLNERVSIHNNLLLKEQQQRAMLAGWPWPILLLIENLTGEGRNWSGTLGFALNRAGRSVNAVLYLSSFLWLVWMICFTIAAHLACKPLILSGILELLSAGVYAIQVYVYIVPYVMIDGNKLSFSLGWSWWLTLILGLFHILCGIILFAYEHFKPGKLSTIFEVDFGLPTHRLNIKKIHINHDNDSSLDNTDGGFETDNIEKSTYESFYQPNSLEPSPDLSVIKQQGVVSNTIFCTPDKIQQGLVLDKICYTPDIKQQGFDTKNDCFTPVMNQKRLMNEKIIWTPDMRQQQLLSNNIYTPENKKQELLPDKMCYFPDIKQQELVTNNNCYTPMSASRSTKNLIDEELNSPTDTNKINSKRRSILFQTNHSTPRPHKIYVH